MPVTTARKIRNILLLLLTALIWGVAFVAQKSGGSEIGAYSFNGIRSFIGCAALVLFLLLREAAERKKTGAEATKPCRAGSRRDLILGGIVCGTVLFLASTAQQLGLYYGADAGAAGFLTACYMVLVPILSIFLGKKCRWYIWLGVLAVGVGLYLLCMCDSAFRLRLSDGLILLCALLFAVHILVIDYFSPRTDGIRLSCVQFLVCGILSLLPMLFFDAGLSAEGIRSWLRAFSSRDAWISLLYAGIGSCGIGYTLQIVAQKGMNPTVASMILSLESVFSALAGSILLRERMSGRSLFGCALIFAAILFVQIPFDRRKEKE